MRVASLAVLAAMLVSGCGPAAERLPVVGMPLCDPGGTDDFKFVVMGDNRPWWGGSDNITQNAYFAENIRGANASGGDFAVISGDMIYGYTKDRALMHRMWDGFERASAHFQIPCILVVGNHDIQDRQSAEVWRERRGATHFSWDYKGCHFIVLDSEVVGEIDRITGAQLKWLEADLKNAAGARRIFVFLHKPLWDFGPKERLAENQWNKKVHPLLAAAGVDTVFAGHEHEYVVHPTRDGVRYVVSGGAGAELRGPELEGGFFHYLIVSVKDKTSDYALMTEWGRLPADYVTTDSIEAHEGDLAVEPIAALPTDRYLEIRGRIRNPTPRETIATIKWDDKATSWKPLAKEAVLATMRPNEEVPFCVPVEVGSEFLPLPGVKVELLDDAGKRKYLAWDLLGPALTKIGPMVREWNVVGPFDLGLSDNAGKENFLYHWVPGWDGLLPPEKGVDLSASYSGKDRKAVAWQAVKADKKGMVDLHAVYHIDTQSRPDKEAKDYERSKVENVAAIAVAYVYSPRGGVYDFTAGSDDSILVRINGRQVWSRNAMRGLKVDDDSFSAFLAEGWNEVLLKVASRRGEWGFCLRVMDPSGALKFALRPEGPVAAAGR
jgi:hypothetical protein